jgi:hypothetical protein
MAYMPDAENVYRWQPLRNFGDRQGDAIIFRDSDAPKLTVAQLRRLAKQYNQDVKYMRYSATRFVRQRIMPMCEQCLFYRIDGDDVGTCTITDNIVEASQEACTDFRK